MNAKQSNATQHEFDCRDCRRGSFVLLCFAFIAFPSETHT
jgi:hypothetical protein